MARAKTATEFLHHLFSFFSSTSCCKSARQKWCRTCKKRQPSGTRVQLACRRRETHVPNHQTECVVHKKAVSPVNTPHAASSHVGLARPILMSRSARCFFCFKESTSTSSRTESKVNLILLITLQTTAETMCFCHDAQQQEVALAPSLAAFFLNNTHIMF